MKLSNKTYDVLKFIVLKCLPAAITFIGVVLPVLKVDAEITSTIITIIGAVATLIGTLIGISTTNYYKQENESEGFGDD